MSYEPGRHNLSEFISAWNTTNQTLPTYSGNGTTNTTVLELDTIGEGDSTIVSNTITPPESGLKGYFIGDLRSEGTSGTNAGDIYSIRFDTSLGDLAAGCQSNRYNEQDEQCYGLGYTAKIRLHELFRCQGYTLAPWVRVLGVLT